jgi:hypothetical protein
MHKHAENCPLCKILFSSIEENSEEIPREGGGFFHIYEKDDNKIVIEFNKRRPNSRIKIHLMGLNEKVREPQILKNKYGGKKIYVYNGTAFGKKFPVYVITDKNKRPFGPKTFLRLEEPQILSSSKTELMEKRIDKVLN